MSTELYYIFCTNYIGIHGNYNGSHRSLDTNSWSLEERRPPEQVLEQKHMHISGVRRERLLLWRPQRVLWPLESCHIWMKSTEALWLFQTILCFDQFWCLPLSVCTILSGSGTKADRGQHNVTISQCLLPIRCICHRAILSLPILYHQPWKCSMSQE